MATAAGEWPQHRQEGGGGGNGLEERSVGRFHGGEGAHGQFGAAVGDVQSRR
jgi:hypothetical protein